MTEATLSIVVVGADTELGLATTRQLVAQGYQVMGLAQGKDSAPAIRANGGLCADVNLTSANELKQIINTVRANVVLNLAPQLANTLLSDGKDWKNFDKTLLATTTALLEALRDSDIQLLVHTSYAFLYGNAIKATENATLNPPGNDTVFAAAIAAEQRVGNSKVPACILRMGYLYGPQSQDLKLYIRSFELGRPYFAGPTSNLGNWLHFEDAAQALVHVAKQQPSGAVFNVVDRTPVSFTDFIDFFAFSLSRSRPGHIPMWLTPLALLLVVTPQQVELLKLQTTVNSDAITQQMGWSPRYPSYREGLQQTVQIWQTHKEI